MCIRDRNNGDGTFTDVTQIAGVTCPHLSTSAAWADIDLDGDLDLYVCNYVTYTVEDEKPCYFKDIRIYCGPLEYPGITGRLFQNNGDGTFSDITIAAGVHEPESRGLGVVFSDLNNDGWIDIYVANDMTSNTIFVNQKTAHYWKRRFYEVSLIMGKDLSTPPWDLMPEIMTTTEALTSG